MKYTAVSLCTTLLAVASSSLAHPDLGSFDGSSVTRPRSFHIEKVRRNPLNLPRRRNRERAATATQDLDNEDFLYYANISLGTPPQRLRLQLDTGSSDIWVESSSSDLCTESDKPCDATGTFNRGDSSTYERVSGDFQISYVDGEFAQGDYGKDVFQLGSDIEVTGLQFGIGLESTSTEGILGIGFPQNEVQVQRLGKAPYPGLTDLMVEQKLIKSRAYSLWLNDLDASKGEILFGGVDTAKFSGKLTTLPIDKRAADSKPREFIITLTGVGLTNAEGESLTLTNKSFAVPALLDTGTTYTYLPTTLFTEISNQVGAQIDAKTTVPIVPCDVRGYDGSINYEFSGAVINVPIKELILDAFTLDGTPATFTDGTPLCYFGVLDAGDDSNVLGDTFLRSAYVVFDLDNEEISIGKTLYNVTDSKVLEIGSGPNAVPDATGAASAVTVAPTATDEGRINTLPPATGGIAFSATSGFARPTHTSAAIRQQPPGRWVGVAMGAMVAACGSVF